LLENLEKINLKDVVYGAVLSLEKTEQNSWRPGESYLGENENKLKINRKRRTWKKIGGGGDILFIC
jgi:hypothetical protein